MHGGTAAILGIVSRAMTDRKVSDTINAFLPGICIAVVIHSFFNHFILPPEISTLCLLPILPSIVIIVFNQSEKATRHWLGVGFDMDVELLSTIVTGDVSETKIG